MDRRTRICVWIILIGLANFSAYTIGYLWIGGEAVNGQVVRMGDGQTRYYLQSWQDHPPQVSRGLFVYSGVHSISIWPTVGAILLAMLTLAKDRLVSSMRSTVVRGRTLITILATLITIIVIVIMVWFVLVFVHRLSNPRPPIPPPAAAAGNSKSETRNSKQTPSSKLETQISGRSAMHDPPRLELRISDLFRVSDFGFRVSVGEGGS